MDRQHVVVEVVVVPVLEEALPIADFAAAFEEAAAFNHTLISGKGRLKLNLLYQLKWTWAQALL